MSELLLGPRSSQSLFLNPSDNLNFSNGKEKFVIKVKPSQAKASVICQLSIELQCATGLKVKLEPNPDQQHILTS